MSKRIALVLGSGGARGYAHIGVIDEIVSRGYEITAISGCSMGALIAGVYAAGELDSYRDWVCKLDYFDVLKLVDVTWSPMGAMRASKVMSKLEHLVGDIRLEDLPIAVTTVAADLTRQREVWFQSGSMLKAIRASIAVPGIITPVRRGDQILVDGGLLNPLPIIPTVSAQADLILAVNATAQTHQPVTLAELLPADEVVQEQAREAELEAQGQGFSGWMDGVRGRVQHMFSGFGNSDEEEGNSDENDEADNGDTEKRRKSATERAWGRLDIMLASFEITQAALAKYKIAGYPPDILVEIPKTVCGAYEFHRAESLIRLGRHLAAQALDRFEGHEKGSAETGQSMITEPATGKPAN